MPVRTCDPRLAVAKGFTCQCRTIVYPVILSLRSRRENPSSLAATGGVALCTAKIRIATPVTSVTGSQ